MLNKAYKNLGDYSAERQKWNKAAKYYKLANDYENLAYAYYKMEDFTQLEQLINYLPENSETLEKLGQIF